MLPSLQVSGSRGLPGTAPLLTPQATCCLLELPLPLIFALGGHEKIKRSSGREGRGGEPQSLAGPSFKPQPPPPPAAQPCPPCAVTHVAAFLWAQPLITHISLALARLGCKQHCLSLMVEVLSLTHLTFRSHANRHSQTTPSRKLPDAQVRSLPPALHSST